MKLLKEQPTTTFKGLVFDIKRFAVHDGKGIRTTVFLKGCPLRCQWCQNPEGLSPKQIPLYFENKCIHCRLCEKHAYVDQMTYQDKPYLNQQYQGNFDNLIDICPSTAIRYDSQYYDEEELFSKIKEDMVFFKNGGGVTFSGGEPFMQSEFLIAMLKRCKQEHIHTAIETSGYTSLDKLQKALPYLDQIYIDFKLYDDELHKTYTGVSNQLIKQNINYILQSKHKDKVIIRTPLIPHISATNQNIQDICKYLTHIYPDVHYELLNYNPLASAKYELVHLTYKLKQYQAFTNEEMKNFYDIVYQSGLKNLIVEKEN